MFTFMCYNLALGEFMKNLLLLSLTSISLFASTAPLHVELDIYTNKAFMSKTYSLKQLGEITTKVPNQTTLASIKYRMDEQCKVSNSTLSNTLKYKNPEIYALQQEREKKVNQVTALVVNGELLKTISLEKINEVSKLDEISSYLTKKMAKNLTLIAYLKKEIAKIDEKLAETNGVNERYKILTTTYTCNETDKNLKITYSLNSIRYTPFYNINANINNSSVTIEKEATLLYGGTENYENIDLGIYSYRYNQNVAPQTFRPKYLGQKREMLFAKSAVAMDSVQKSPTNGVKNRYKELATKSFYNIKGIKLMAGKKNILHVDKEVVDALFKTAIDAYGTNKAYMEATIKTTKEYSVANANYLLNQNPIAFRYMNRIQKDKETKIYFGEDEHIQVQKELIKTLDEKTFFGDEKISTQNWKYTITNTKPYATNIEFITRVPVSKDADIKVKTFSKPQFTSQNAKGKTIWDFILQENESKNIIFGYEVSNSK